MSDRRKRNRNEQRSARALVASKGINYMQALNTIRSEAEGTGRGPRAVLAEQCENILGRRGMIAGMYSRMPSRAQLVADALVHARDLLATRVAELAPGESTGGVADAAETLAGAALAAIDPANRIKSPRQLVELVRESPSQIPWSELPSERRDGNRTVDDTREWWSRVRRALTALGDTEGADMQTLRAVLRLATEYAFWSETGVADLP